MAKKLKIRKGGVKVLKASPKRGKRIKVPSRSKIAKKVKW